MAVRDRLVDPISLRSFASKHKLVAPITRAAINKCGPPKAPAGERVDNLFNAPPLIRKAADPVDPVVPPAHAAHRVMLILGPSPDVGAQLSAAKMATQDPRLARGDDAE